MPKFSRIIALYWLSAGLSACYSPTAIVEPVKVSEVPPVAAQVVPGPPPPAPPFPATWPVPAEALKLVHVAGLDAQEFESETFHIHSHLNIFWDGAPVFVAANIGIHPDFSWFSPLHTHELDGILHIESPRNFDIKLNQFFTEWGVSLGTARVYDGGVPVENGAGLVLRDLQDITVVYGTPPASIPTRYVPWDKAPPISGPSHQAAPAAP